MVTIQIDPQDVLQALANLMNVSPSGSNGGNGSETTPVSGESSEPDVSRTHDVSPVPPEVPCVDRLNRIFCEYRNRLRAAVNARLKRQKWTLSTLAEHVGLSRAAVDGILRGSRTGYYESHVRLIVGARLNPLYLFFGQGDPLLD